VTADPGRKYLAIRKDFGGEREYPIRYFHPVPARPRNRTSSARNKEIILRIPGTN